MDVPRSHRKAGAEQKLQLPLGPGSAHRPVLRLGEGLGQAPGAYICAGGSAEGLDMNALIPYSCGVFGV